MKLGSSVDAAVAGGAAGTIHAKLRRLTTDLAALVLGVLVKPFTPLAEIGLTKIIDADDAVVATGTFSKSVEIVFGGTFSGEILNLMLVQTEVAAGAILADLAGELWVFDSDPAITSGNDGGEISVADAQAVIGIIPLDNADLRVENNAAIFSIFDKPLPFHALASVFVAFKSTGATSINSDAGDDEELHINAWLRRDS